mgnify:FL=1|jgi:hypothetical protein
MNIVPENRHLLVHPVEEEATVDNTVQLLMPDDFRPPQSPYVVCNVLDIAEDSKFYNSPIQKVLIERRMLHEVTLDSETHYLVLENYVFGRLQ